MVSFINLLHLQNNQVSSQNTVGTQLVHVPGHAMLTESTMGESKATTWLKDHQVPAETSTAYLLAIMFVADETC